MLRNVTAEVMLGNLCHIDSCVGRKTVSDGKLHHMENYVGAKKTVSYEWLRHMNRNLADMCRQWVRL